MTVDEIREWAEEGSSARDNAALAIADLRDAYNLIANAWSRLPARSNDRDYDRARFSIEVTMVRVVNEIRFIGKVAKLPEEMTL
jgi:hypothetical protein